MFVCSGCLGTTPELCGSHNRHLLSPSSGGWKSEIKAPATSVSGGCLFRAGRHSHLPAVSSHGGEMECLLRTPTLSDRRPPAVMTSFNLHSLWPHWGARASAYEWGAQTLGKYRVRIHCVSPSILCICSVVPPQLAQRSAPSENVDGQGGRGNCYMPPVTARGAGEVGWAG